MVHETKSKVKLDIKHIRTKISDSILIPIKYCHFLYQYKFIQ